MKNIVISIFIVLFVIACTADGAWDLLRSQADIFQILGNYTNRIKVTINNSAQDENLTNFPVLVILNASRVTYGDIDTYGTGIKFINSDFSTELSYEVEKWTLGGDSFLWVKIPSITALSNSDYFWIYYSTVNNSDNTHPADVWSNNYLAVWHMNDSDGSIKDSTSLGLDGITHFVAGPGPIAGNISGAQHFNDNAANITVTPATIFDNIEPVTFSFWMYDNGYLDLDTIFGKGGFRIRLLDTDPNTIYLGVDYDGGNNLELSYANSWIPGEWSSFYITWTGASGFNKVDIFNNGTVLSNPVIKNNGQGNRITDAGTDLVLGNDLVNDKGFEGNLDEIRISNIVRSPAWISAQYLSMTDSFLSYGAEENVSN